MLKKVLVFSLACFIAVNTMMVTAFAAEPEYEKVKAQKEQIVTQETMRIRPMAGSYTLEDKDTDEHDGQEMYASFEADLVDNFAGSSMSGRSSAVWLGSEPFDADTIDLTTTVKLTGAGISVSAGGSGFDVDAGLTSSTLTMNDDIDDDWRLYQNYSNVTFDGVDLYYRQTATAKFEFGYERYYCNATDSVWP